MKQDDEKDQEQKIYRYQVLEYIEQLMVLYQDERYYEEDLRDMEWNQFHQYDLCKLHIGN